MSQAHLHLTKAASCTLLFCTVSLGQSVPNQLTSVTNAGSEACAGCHSEIYKSYQKTVMARASGYAADGLVTGEFDHKPSGVHYRVYNRDGRSWMSYERPGDSQIHGQRELLYYVGSGRKGRSYLFSVEGFLFETPINWYSQEGRWNMAPAYTEAREIPMNLPALLDCLNCHTSGVQAPIAGTENRFAGKPFLHNGITCQRCHGPGESHLSGKGPIVNPAKLSPERRDSICMECHFEGTVAIEQPGRHLYQFQPGENLSDYIHYFLLTGTRSPTPQAVSQFEALSQSVCKQRSGDKMSCVSCHDPHASPSAAEKVSYYRGKCLACHGEAFGAKHHPENANCVQCHMPALPSKDVAHTQATDHRILRRPGMLQLADFPAAPRLPAFPNQSKESVRDLALAWETLAQRDVKTASVQAEKYLRSAVGMNLAMAFCATGQFKTARDYVRRGLVFNPDLGNAKRLVEHLSADPPQCKP